MGSTFTESSQAHRSSPFGLDWTQKFYRISGLGLDGQIFHWAGWTGLLFEATTMDWAGPNFANGPRVSVYSRTTKMRTKRANMPYFTPNFLGFDNLHQFCPFQLLTNARNYDFVANITTK